MMLKKWMKMVLGSAALAVFGFGMSGQATADTLHIGAVLDFVSYSAPFDVPAEEGIRMAVEEINAAGGIGGKTKIKLSIVASPAQRLPVLRNSSPRALM